MATYKNLSSLFTAIADAIRAKTGETGKIVADSFPTKIANLSTGLKVYSITTSGTYDSATYHGGYWAAIDANGYLLLVVEGGTSTSYESIKFSAGTLPSGVTLASRSSTTDTSATSGAACVAVFSGITSSVDIALAFDDRDATNDYVDCTVTITPTTASGLPSGYTLLGYIESSGTQYIDTGLIPSNHAVEVKFDSLEYNNDEHLFGTTAGAAYFHFTLYNHKYYWGTNGSEGNGGDSYSSGIKTLQYNYGDNHAIILDGVTLGSGSVITSSATLTLCRRTVTNFQGRYYYFKVTDRSTGKLVRDFVPCVNPNGEIGMYDIANRKFYGNAGSGAFTGA